MNINVFETKNEEGMGTADTSSFESDEVFQMKQKIENRKNKQKRVRMVWGALVIVVILLAASTAYSQYKLYKLTKDEMTVGAGTTKGEIGASSIPSTPKTGEDVIKSLSRHILLPQGNPQIAEVKDATKLRDSQAFFKDTQNGDVVVVYDTSIFIYRPSADIVVAAGDISGVGQVKP